VEFREFYLAALSKGTLFEMTGAAQHVPEGAEETTPTDDWIATDPIHFAGRALLDREVAVMVDALGDSPTADAFLTSTAPLSVEPGRQKGIYATDEEHIEAIAEAMRTEYEAIAKAGLQVQVDDAWFGALWDRIGIPMGMDGYRKFCELRIEALNHALRNIPEEQIRYHLCWGSWHGPHSADLELPEVVDLMLKIKAQMYLFEAANVRHEHEIWLWADVDLPDGKILAPGVVTRSQGSSAARTSSPRPTAVSVCGSTRRSRGRSCAPSSRAHESRPTRCGEPVVTPSGSDGGLNPRPYADGSEGSTSWRASSVSPR